jgi:hypothetical protein
VSADGSTLLTHVPYWLARAQLAGSEREALGLLRMLNCGSDAEPYAAGARGAYGTLTRAGLDGRRAYATVIQLASLDRAAADHYLAGLGMAADTRAAVLAATHCAPPASYLVLSSRQAAFPGWWQLGTWDPRRSGAAGDPERRAIGQRGFTTADWIPCQPVAGGERRCAIGRANARGAAVDAVAYSDADPGTVRVVTTDGDSERRVTPDLLLLVQANTVATIGGDATDDGTAVLLDPDRHRVLVGTPSALGSLYTRLVFLDGLGATRLRKIDERRGAWDERVSTWAIEW